jgi:hypothetical protein
MVEKARKLDHLLTAARAVTPDCEVRFRGTNDEDKWICLVAVGTGPGAATIFESKPGALDEVMDSATAKLKGVSKRMMAALDVEEPASSKKT